MVPRGRGHARAVRRRDRRDGRAAAQAVATAPLAQGWRSTRSPTWRCSRWHRPTDHPRSPLDAADRLARPRGPRPARRRRRYAPIADARADHDPAGLPARRGAAGVAPGLPHRLAAGPVRRAPGLHEVPGADERRVHRRAVLDRGAELAAASGRPAPRSGASPRSTRCRSAARWSSTTRASTTPACSCGFGDAELVAYSQKCTHLSCAVIPRPDARRHSLPVPRGLLRSAIAAVPSPARRRGRCRASCSRSAGDDDLRHRHRVEDQSDDASAAVRSPASSARRSSTACWRSS